MDKLAIDGGPPVRTEPFPPRRPFGEREVELASEAIRSQNLFGPTSSLLARFERRFAQLYGVASAVASTSGTSAIHVALAAVGPEPGDEIITAPITDAGTVAPILFQNCVPVFADVDDSYTVDPADVAAKITARTRAIVAVHLFGNPCDMDALLAVARSHGVALIEDCCQAHLTPYKGQLCGTMGDAGCFSFQQSKHMTTGDGGMTITDDPRLAERMALFRDKGWGRGGGPRGYHLLGLNYRMTALHAAVGLAQLEKVAGVVARRHELGERLSERVRGAPGVVPAPVTEGAWATYWHYGLRVVGGDAGRFAAALGAEGVHASRGYIGKPIYACMAPLTGGPTFGSSRHPLDGCHGARRLDYGEETCPRAQRVLDQMVVLGLHEHLGDGDVEDMAAGVRKVAEGLAAGT
ncbi:MAG: DegT/DnrJ/EryC1/StrS family aminotransferase [Candidatus Brocadiia bacterium]